MRWTTIDGAVEERICEGLVESFRDGIGTYGFKNKVDFWSHRLINSHDLPVGSELRSTIDGIGQLVIDTILREWGELAAMQVSQLVSWPAGTAQGAHIDRFFPDTAFAAILYLNADYSGGETFLELPEETRRVSPRTGRLLVFEGTRIMHGVEQIGQGVRYTNAMWLSAPTAGPQ
ncbi:hypothetical protein Afil01_22900 [Actinorhabdospora filicis]|uniref:Fe2OG dioxygenase domain-containing protein n=1 Tax=Actinorhabdospora filicis TaxID=1785913 RepID=A0A9W6W8Z3_9ACTN|nr:2OG-Fe(II) oxygenase [Actinorhabdospora filicis]GLZ77483.1 hypothetical protein Afil01_22900 [Actinorhabdospora filicis]